MRALRLAGGHVKVFQSDLNFLKMVFVVLYLVFRTQNGEIAPVFFVWGLFPSTRKGNFLTNLCFSPIAHHFSKMSHVFSLPTTQMTQGYLRWCVKNAIVSCSSFHTQLETHTFLLPLKLSTFSKLCPEKYGLQFFVHLHALCALPKGLVQ